VALREPVHWSFGEAPRGQLGNVSPALSLTFDDGPDELWTACVLRALERHAITGTFFMVGERVLATPTLARAVVAAGHEVQLHCHRHIRHTELNEAEIARDASAALGAFARIGVRPRYWRPPWGVCTPATVRVAERNGLTLCRWSIDTRDWRGDSAAAMLAHAIPLLATGGAVLMHDALGPGALRAGCENTVELLDLLIARAKSEGLDIGLLTRIGPATERQTTLRLAEPRTAMIGSGC
jgi:peptidoglycan/xylan/chitin deacetylase (PgdA/CDA1 family)